MDIKENKKYWWNVESLTANDGYYPSEEFMLKGEDIISICHSGDNAYDVEYVMQKPYVKKQLQKFRNDFLRGVIRQYGDDGLQKFKTRHELKMFLVWDIAWAIHEDEFYREQREGTAA